MTPRRKTSPRPLARPVDLGLAPRALVPATFARRLPTVAALSAALLGLVGGVGCGASTATDPADAIRADAPPRRIAVKTTTTAGDDGKPGPIGIALVIDPEPTPRVTGGKMRVVTPTPTPTAIALPHPMPPHPAGGPMMPLPTPRPIAMPGGKAAVRPPSLGTATIGGGSSAPCAKPGVPETY